MHSAHTRFLVMVYVYLTRVIKRFHFDEYYCLTHWCGAIAPTVLKHSPSREHIDTLLPLHGEARSNGPYSKAGVCTIF